MLNSIVAITDLADKIFMSWQYENETMWLRNHLSSAFSRAKVHIYDYDSRLQDNVFKARLEHFTSEFVDLLSDYVKEQSINISNRSVIISLCI